MSRNSKEKHKVGQKSSVFLDILQKQSQTISAMKSGRRNFTPAPSTSESEPLTKNLGSASDTVNSVKSRTSSVPETLYKNSSTTIKIKEEPHVDDQKVSVDHQLTMEFEETLENVKKEKNGFVHIKVPENSVNAMLCTMTSKNEKLDNENRKLLTES